jgi:dTDP-4-amino-4,6-dideoxygalactose transaminase
MSYFRPISISLSPNVEKDDLKIALNLIIRPWLWKKGKAIKELENEFKNYLGVKYAFSFNSGRSSFFAILKSLNLPGGSEVLLQAFTCNAVPNPVLWAGLKPVYVDCNRDDFNINTNDLENKITVNTKAVIVQHTFGLPADMDKVRAVCSAYNLILIEDCAHSLGAEYGSAGSPQVMIKAGAHSKASFFSFSRDKIISSVYGGMAVTNDDKLGEALQQAQGKMGFPSPFWIFQQILHPIFLYYFILPIYNLLDLGKIFLVLSQWLHVLSKAVSWQEKQGKRPDYFPRAMPNGLAIMALNQFNKLDKFDAHRQKLADYYYNELKDTKFELPRIYEGASASGEASATRRKNVFLRFTVKHKDAHEIIYEAWHKQNILLGDWYTTPIAPFDTNIDEIKYVKGSCENAERLAKTTLNLPTHINISEKDAERIVNFLKKWNSEK